MFEIKQAEHLYFAESSTTGMFLYEYSRGLCEDVSLHMKEGVWLTEWADGVDVRTSEFIPHRRPPGVVRNLRLRPRQRLRHQHGVLF